MLEGNLGGSDSSQFSNGQNPQTQTGATGLSNTDASNFQSPATTDLLSQSSKTSSLTVVSTGTPNTAVATTSKTPWSSILISVALIIVVVVLFMWIYRYAKTLDNETPEDAAKEESNSPFLKGPVEDLNQDKPNAAAAAKPAPNTSVKKAKKKGKSARRRK